MARINKDQLGTYFDYGVDLANRRVFLFDGVDEDAIGYVIKALYLLDSQNKEKKDPIELFIGSFGGSEYEMYALYDVIHTLESPIHTTAIGKCMSAAPLLVVAGAPGHRYATPNTWFMVHESWAEFDSTRVDVIKNELDHYKDMGDRWYQLMAHHTKKDAKFWRAQCAKVGDKFFDAWTAKEWGLIDHVWDEKDGED